MIFRVAKGQNRLNSDINNFGTPLSYVKCLTLVLLVLCLGNTALADSATFKKFNSVESSGQDLCGVSMADSVTGYIKSATSSQIFYVITITNTGTGKDSFNLSKAFISGINLFVFIETVEGLSLTQSPGINPGGSYSFIVRFVTPAGTAPDTLNHTDVIATSLTCQTTNSTHITTHVYGGQPPTGDSCDLSIKKTANLNPVTVGDTLVYTITVINSLSASAKGVFVIDTLPSNLQYVTCNASAPSTKYSLNFSSATNIIQFKYLTSLGLNEIITITIKVKVKCEAVPSVVNRTIVSSSSYDNNATNDNSGVTTTVNTNLSAPFATGITSCYNATAGLTATGVASGYGYRWYNTASGSTPLGLGSLYTTAALYTTATYYVAFYNLSSPVCEGPRTSVIVTIKEAPSITSSPSSVSVCPNNNATFSVNASGPSLTYEWQVSTNNESSWSSLSNSATYTGTATSVLTVANVSSGLNGFKYRCNVRNEGCAYFLSSSVATLTVRMPYSWLGVNTNWSDNQNWCQGVPDTSSDVTIPAGLSYYPVITGVAVINDLHIDNGASVTVGSGGIVQIFGDITNYGMFDAINGTIDMRGTSPQNLAGSMFYNNTIKNLIVGNTSSSGLSVSSTANDTLKISWTISFGNSNSKLNTGDNITLLSTRAATASIGKLSAANSITGQVIVEHYINTGTAFGQHGKSWQFLSVPTNTPAETIKKSWMENGIQTLSPTGYGIWVTGAAGTSGGFDAASSGAAMKTYSPAGDSWVSVTNPGTTPIHNEKGYMVFVRGDRSVFNLSGPNSVANPTNLRSKGALMTGTLAPINVPAGKYCSIGNPYASRVNFSDITRTSNIDNVFYVWDPLLYGDYGYGGYQILSATNNFQPTAPNNIATSNYQFGVSNPYIESGQAFFVHNSSDSGASVIFTEDAKADNKPVASKTTKVFAKRQFFRTYLYNTAATIADGNAVAFDDDFVNSINRDDALKIMNTGENFGLKRAGKILAVEARMPIEASDTIFYNINNFRRQTYQLVFAPENMRGSGLSAYLIDKYLKTTTLVRLDENSSTDITINTDPGSSAADRLMVVFKAMTTLPLTFISIQATQKNANIVVTWKVESESNLLQYEVERSSDGNNFIKAGTTGVRKGGINNYNWIDEQALAGYNYYRIRSIDVNGTSTYSRIVKILITKVVSEISVYPNPVVNGVINLQLKNQEAGNYSISLLNQLGEIILFKKIAHVKGSSLHVIKLNRRLVKEMYELVIIKPGGKPKVIKLIN